MSWDAWARGGPVDRVGAVKTGLTVASAAASALAATLNDLEHEDAATALALSRDVDALLVRVRELVPRMSAPTTLYVQRAVAAAEKETREQRARDHEDDLRHFKDCIQETRK